MWGAENGGGEWAVYAIGGLDPLEHHTTTRYEDAKTSAETALRRLNAQT